MYNCINCVNFTQTTKKGSNMYQEEYEEEEPYEPPTLKRRATAGHDVTFSQRKTEVPPVQKSPRRQHTIFYFVLGMLFFLVIWSCLTMLVMPWLHGLSVQWT